MNEFDPVVPVSRLADKDMQGAPAALVRAARRAREMPASGHRNAGLPPDGPRRAPVTRAG